MMVSSGGMTNRLDRLEKAGLVRRRRNREDRRAIIVELSEMGLKKIDHILQDHVRGQEKLLELLDKKERESLENLLAALINSMSHQEQP